MVPYAHGHDVHPLPRRAGPPRRPAVQRQRDARPPPDLDRHPRHRAARHGPRSVLRPGRCADRGVHHRQRPDGDRAGPTARPARARHGSCPWSRRSSGSRSWCSCVSLESGWPDPVAFVAAALAGAAYPPIGSCVRARWSYVLAGEATEIQTAYALESVIDEAIFIIGPTVATVLATTWHAWAGLGLALVTGVGGSFYLAAQRDTQPDPQPRGPGEPAPGPRCRGGGWCPWPWSAAPSARCSPLPRWPPSPSPASRAPRRTPGCCSPAGPSAACSPGW